MPALELSAEDTDDDMPALDQKLILNPILVCYSISSIEIFQVLAEF